VAPDGCWTAAIILASAGSLAEVRVLIQAEQGVQKRLTRDLKVRDILANLLWKHHHNFALASASILRTMTRFTYILTVIAMGFACSLSIASCGGDSPGGDIVAQVGNTSISRATLSEWMQAVLGGDYYEHLNTPAPAGLVSDPPHYAKCVTAAEQIVPRSSGGQLATPKSQIAAKCHQLYRALKEQALELLISIDSRIEEGRERGVPATNADVRRLFARVRAQQFPKQSEYVAYLEQRHWTPSVEIMQLKRNIVTSKIEEKFQARGEGWQDAFAHYLAGSVKKWTAKTSCQPGYVISVCKEYKPSSHTSATNAPAILLEELAGRS
jgi:hypothetical protein